MNNYKFPDISHHKGDVDMQAFADIGARIVISKASDSFHMPDKAGKYDFAANRHTDAWFADNVVKTRETGLIAGSYHFARFTYPGNNKTEIVNNNLRFYMDALNSLPLTIKETMDLRACGIIDAEQTSYQLKAAGLTPVEVSAMLWDIVQQWADNFDRVILYSGSWWTNQWITNAAMAKIATKTAVWEPEYGSVFADSSGYITHPDGYSINPQGELYMPSVPYGYRDVFTDDPNKWEGYIFAHQYGLGLIPRINSRIDMNRMNLGKEDLAVIFGQDMQVDPPGEHTHEDIVAELVSINDHAASILDLTHSILFGGPDGWGYPGDDDEEEDDDVPDVEDPDDDSSEPNEPFYTHIRFKAGEKDFTPAYRVFRVDNGKYKDDKIDGDYVKFNQELKFLTRPIKDTLIDEDGVERFGWWLKGDGNDVRKNMLLANRFDFIPEEYGHDDLIYVEGTLNGKLMQFLLYLEPVLYHFVDAETGERMF